MTTSNEEVVRNRGERSVEMTEPGWEFTHRGMIYLQHLFAYHQVLPQCDGARVLDIGCGSGYGSRLLGQRAASVLGLDVDETAIQWATARNDRPNVQYLCDTLDSPTLQEQKFDVIVSFQVIEHIEPPKLDNYLTRIARWLAPHGTLYLTTPNRLRRLPLLRRPWNPYHCTEYSARSLQRALAPYFEQVQMQYITGNAQVMGAEWARGTRITPLRYYLSGPLAWLVARAIGKLLRPWPQTAKQIPAFLLAAESKLFTYGRHPRGAKWQQEVAFSMDDFQLTSDFDWWALDLFARVGRPRQEFA